MAGSLSFSVSSAVSSSSSAVLLRPSLSFSRFSKSSFVPMRVATGAPQRTRFMKIYALSSNDIKVGTNIEVDGAPWKVLEFLHVKPGKGAAFVRTKMRNYVSGNTVEKTFRAGSSLDAADIYKETKQFTYKDGVQFVFMDMNTFEEIRLDVSDVGDKTKWLKEGMECNLLFWNGKVIDFEVPTTVQLRVVVAEPGVKGDTVQGATKLATLETGATVTVPLFVNEGDEIIVDSRSGQYISRV